LAGTDQQASTLQSGGNMEGKEVRFGIANSVLFATVTTDASCGAINGQHDSFTPLGGMVPLINIMLAGVVAGGLEDHLAQHDIDQRNHSAKWRKRIVLAVDRATARVGRHSGEQYGVRDSEADLFPFHVSA